MKSILQLLLLLLLLGCKNNIEKSAQYNEEAARYFNQGDYSETVRLAKKAIENNEQNAAAHINLGVAMKKLNYPAKEIDSIYRRVLEFRPENEKALVALMVLHFDNKDFSRTAQYAERYLEKYQPQDAYLSNLIGETFRLEKDYNRSYIYLLKAVEFDSTRSDAVINLGELFMDTGDYAKALQFLNKGKTLTPEDAELLNEIAISHYVLGNLDSALVYTNLAVDLKNDPVFIINKGVYLIKMDSIGSGCKWFSEAEKSGKKVAEIYGTDSEPYQLQQEYCK